MGRKRKNKKKQTFEVYPEDLGRYQYLMNDLPEYQNTGETDEDINAAINAQNTSEENEKAKLIQQMMKDNPEMFKDHMPRYNTSLYGSKDDYTLGNPNYNPLNPASPMGAMLGLFSAGKNLVKGIGTGFKTKYHGINPDTGEKYGMQDFKRHTITNPFDDTRLISKDVAFDIIYNKNKGDYFRGDLFKTPQQANAMLMNDYFKDRHEMYTDADNPDQAAFSLRTMDDQGNVTYDDIEIPNPDYDPNEPTHPVNNPEFTTRPFNPLTDRTHGDNVEDHLANASMQQMYYDDKGVITKFQSYNDDGELVWTNYNPNVEYGEYETTSQEEMNRRLNDPNYQGPGTIGGATDPFATDVNVSETEETSNQVQRMITHCEGQGKVYNPATGQCDESTEGRYGLEQFVYGGTLPKFQDEGENQIPEMNFDTYQDLIISDEEMYNTLNPPAIDESFDYENDPRVQQWYQDNPLSPVTSREGPFGSNVDEEIDWTEENEWSDIQDVDVQSSWRDEGETGIKGALAGAYRFGDAALKTGTLGRITKGLGDVAGLLDPLTNLSNAWRMDREKTEAEMKKNARSSEDIFATVETSSRGDWDQWGGMYKPDKHIDEIRGTAQEGKEMTLTGSTPQGGPDYSMLQEFTGDDLPFPYDPAFLEWQKLTLGIPDKQYGGQLPKLQIGDETSNTNEIYALTDLENKDGDYSDQSWFTKANHGFSEGVYNAAQRSNKFEAPAFGNIGKVLKTLDAGKSAFNAVSDWWNSDDEDTTKIVGPPEGSQVINAAKHGGEQEAEIDMDLYYELMQAGADMKIIR